MSEAVSILPATQPEPPAAPAPVFNCPECQHWLPEGALACPDCGAMRYAAHLRTLAIDATAHEQASEWPAARASWQEALRWVPEGTKQRLALEQRIALIDTRLNKITATKEKWTRRLGPFAPVVFFLAKAKSFIFILFKLKFLLSFAAFFGMYWGLFGWRFALGFMVAILIHESGHYVAAKRRGLEVDLPVFTFWGAYVRWYNAGVSLETLSSIALAGPTFGLIASVLFGALAIYTHAPLWSALAHVAAWLNLINLVPILGLDGSQATYALDRTQRWLILATSLIFFGVLKEGPFAFIAAGMAWRLWKGGYAEQPSTRTLIRFVLLLFALGIVIYLFPDSRRYASF